MFMEVCRARKEGIEHFSVGAGIIDCKGRLLVLRRRKEDSYPNMYEIPGGTVEDNETIEEALYREIYEETGLEVKHIIKYIGYFDYIEGFKKRQFNFIVSVKIIKKITMSEHDNYMWINDSDNIECTPEMRKIIKQILLSNTK